METALPLIAGSIVTELADFDAVARAHQPAIFRYILASLRDVDAAETLTQECLIRAYQARSRFRGDASVKTWLMQIAVNHVRSHVASSRLKFWKRTQRAGVDAAVAAEWLPDGQRSPEAMAAAKQRLAAVWDAAAALSEKQRAVFLLRFVEDMDILEIAAATGMKEGTVKVHLFRALHTVREKLEAKQ